MKVIIKKIPMIFLAVMMVFSGMASSFAIPVYAGEEEPEEIEVIAVTEEDIGGEEAKVSETEAPSVEENIPEQEEVKEEIKEETPSDTSENVPEKTEEVISSDEEVAPEIKEEAQELSLERKAVRRAAPDTSLEAVSVNGGDSVKFIEQKDGSVDEKCLVSDSKSPGTALDTPITVNNGSSITIPDGKVYLTDNLSNLNGTTIPMIKDGKLILGNINTKQYFTQEPVENVLNNLDTARPDNTYFEVKNPEEEVLGVTGFMLPITANCKVSYSFTINTSVDNNFETEIYKVNANGYEPVNSRFISIQGGNIIISIDADGGTNSLGDEYLSIAGEQLVAISRYRVRLEPDGSWHFEANNSANMSFSLHDDGGKLTGGSGAGAGGSGAPDPIDEPEPEDPPVEPPVDPVKEVGSVIVKHITEDGEVLSDWEDVERDKEEGTDYTTSIGTFTGYEFSRMDDSSEPANGKVVANKTLEVIYVYKKATTEEPPKENPPKEDPPKEEPPKNDPTPTPEPKPEPVKQEEVIKKTPSDTSKNTPAKVEKVKTDTSKPIVNETKPVITIEKTATPKTGDESNILLYAGLSIIACAGIITLIVRRFKANK